MTNSEFKKQAKSRLAKWKKYVKIGDTVKYFPDLRDDKFREYIVESEGFLTYGETDAVVFLVGFSGYVCIDHIKYDIK